MKTIAITGGAGYIGSHLAYTLDKMGHNVIILDNLSTGNKDTLKDINCTFIEGSILDYESNEAMLSHLPEIVFHLAAYKSVNESMQLPLKYLYNNIIGSLKLTKQLAESYTPYMVFSSSAAVYDKQISIASEDSKTNPVSYYGHTKLTTEDNIQELCKYVDLECVSLRYFNVAGNTTTGFDAISPKNATNIFPTIMRVIRGNQKQLDIYGTDYNTFDGTAIRDFIHIDDVINAHITVMNYLFSGGKTTVFNIGSETGVSVFSLISEFNRQTDTKIKWMPKNRRPGDINISIADCSKIKTILGWKPEYSDITTLVKTSLQDI